VLFPRNAVLMASKAHNLVPIDTPFTDFSDHNGFAMDCQIARKIGFRGKLVLHPTQVIVANNVCYVWF
jgi:citrate lyase subunit beta/citryl-CoA lyase